MENQNSYNIKAVCNITGLNEHTIRAWEKRYSAITPERTETNRRLYSEDDLQKLLLLRQAVESGHTISNIANYTIEQLGQLLGKHVHTQTAPTEPEFDSLINSAVRSIKAFDKVSLEKLLNESAIRYAKPVLLKKIIIPLLEKVGILWETGEIRVIHEHFASSFLRTYLGNMVENNTTFENSPKIICTTPEGFLHELGALIYALFAMDFGWDALFLGPNLPAEEIVAAVEKNNAQALLLSLIYPKDEPRFGNQLKKIRANTGKKFPVILCGQAASSYIKFIEQENASLAKNLEDFSIMLKNLRKPEANTN